MARTTEHYRDQMLALRPRGYAWMQALNSVWAKMFMALAEEFRRIEERAYDLLTDEADPRNTTELLPEWEQAYGLPDECSPAGSTVSERQAALVARIVATGGQSISYFTEVAEALGFTITITEYNSHNVEDDVDEPIYGDDWQFAMTIATGESEANSAALVCTIDRIKHAQIVTIYEYS